MSYASTPATPLPINSDAATEGLNEGEGAKKVWVVTGTSSGLGRSLVKAALARGDRVVATARTVESIQDFLDDPANADRILTLALDVTSPFETLRAVAKKVVDRWGKVDVLVNNAGAGMPSISEEGGLESYNTQLATNFFGPLNVTYAFLPYMRARRAGTIVFVGSRSAWKTMLPMYGPYAASKAALNAAADAIAAEVAPLGIRVLNAVPGGIRTQNWANVYVQPASPNALLPTLITSASTQIIGKEEVVNANQTVGPVDDPRLADYTLTRQKMFDFMMNIPRSHVPGDPDKTAKAIADTVCGEAKNKEGEVLDWPDLNFLPLGPDAERDIRERCEKVLGVLGVYKDVARGIVADDVEQT